MLELGALHSFLVLPAKDQPGRWVTAGLCWGTSVGGFGVADASFAGEGEFYGDVAELWVLESVAYAGVALGEVGFAVGGVDAPSGVACGAVVESF